jgi:hypothetical protein
MIESYNIRPNGLGIIITQLSFLLAMGRPVRAVVSNDDNIIYDLKRIFNISDDVLTIESGTHGHPDLETDELCTYAPYFHANVITLHGRQFVTGKRHKPCVAFAMHHGRGLSEDPEYRGMPYNKFSTAEQYGQVFTQLTNLGYDVITMNQSRVGLEHKCYMLNELCEFVIGYEGGLGHLAHVLQIPYFCLPWQFNDMGHPGIQPGLWYESHRFHADRRTWFLRDADEFLNWTREELDHKITQLHDQQGNNILFEIGTTMDPETLKIKSKNGRDLTPRIMWCETRGEYTTKFVKEHLPLENMQKYPLKTKTYST